MILWDSKTAPNPRRVRIFEEKVSYSPAVDHECAAAFHAYACPAQRLAHLGKRTGSILQSYCQISHAG